GRGRWAVADGSGVEHDVSGSQWTVDIEGICRTGRAHAHISCIVKGVRSIKGPGRRAVVQWTAVEQYVGGVQGTVDIQSVCRAFSAQSNVSQGIKNIVPVQVPRGTLHRGTPNKNFCGPDTPCNIQGETWIQGPDSHITGCGKNVLP